MYPYCQYSVPGWSYYVHDKHDEARQAFLVWVADGKPRCGIAYQTIYKTKAAFKQTLRFCRRHEEQMKAYLLAKSHDDKNAKTFWGNVAKVSCKQESPAVADKPARRESMLKLLQFDVLIQLCRCCCVRNLRNPDKLSEKLNI